MPAAVVANRVPLVIRHLVQVRQHLLDRLAVERRAGERGVRLVHVGLVVLVVMELHRRLVDVRLERVVGVGERWYLVGHGLDLLGSGARVLSLGFARA
jgi:hypothetical protein